MEGTARHAPDRQAKAEIERHRGTYIHTTGDGLLATFDGPARAVRCAQAIGEAVLSLGLELRSGCHTGEIELAGEDLILDRRAHRGTGRCTRGGHQGGRHRDCQGPGRERSWLSFEDAGERELKGVPIRSHLYRVVS